MLNDGYVLVTIMETTTAKAILVFKKNALILNIVKDRLYLLEG